MTCFYRLFCTLLLAVLALFVHGQELPIDPDLHYGTLDNGLTYYVRHNATPAGRANFYLIVKIGSTVERDDEQGFAHLLEHLLFEGTRHFPGSTIEKFAERHGASVAPDVNAETSHDFTTFHFDNMQAHDTAVVDSVLMMLRDIAADAVIDDKALAKQRAIVNEEWRQGLNLSERSTSQILKQLLPDNLYSTRLPIGDMGVVAAATPADLNRFYKRWYRPELMAVVAVGDFDDIAVTARVKQLFGDLKNSDRSPRIFPAIVPSDSCRLSSFFDNELSSPGFLLLFDYPDSDFNSRNSLQYARLNLSRMLVENLLAMRLQQWCLDHNHAIATGEVKEQLMLAGSVSTRRELCLSCAPRDDTRNAILDAMALLAQAREHGFSPSEVEVARRLMLAAFDNAALECDKTDNATLVDEYCRHFKEGGYIPGIKAEQVLSADILRSITPDDLLDLLRRMVTPDNLNFIYAGPPASWSPSRHWLAEQWQDALNRHYDAPDNIIDLSTPLIDHPVTVGTVVDRRFDKPTGTTRLSLSNGATVILKPTAFKNDEILLGARARGGVHALPPHMATRARLLHLLTSTMRVGNFSAVAINKRMVAEMCALNPDIDEIYHGFTGQCRPASLESLLQLLYLHFNEATADVEAFDATRDGYASMIRKADNNSDTALDLAMSRAMFPSENFDALINPDSIRALSAHDCLVAYHALTANAADFVFTIVGNFDADLIEPLICRYIGSLKGHKASVTPMRPLYLNDRVAQQPVPVNAPGERQSVLLTLGGKMPFTARNNIYLSILNNIFGGFVNWELRESARLTYAVDTQASLTRVPNRWLMNVSFDVAPDNRNDALYSIINLFYNCNMYIDESNFKVIADHIRAIHAIELNTNEYWLQNLLLEGQGLDALTGSEDIYNSLNLEEFSRWLDKLECPTFITSFTDTTPPSH